MRKNQLKRKSAALILCMALLIGTLWTGMIAINSSAAGENYNPLSGFTEGEKPQESPWYYKAENFSENPESDIDVPDDFSQPVVLVPAGVKVAGAPEIEITAGNDGAATVNVTSELPEADEYLLNLYSADAENGGFTFIRSDGLSGGAHTYSDLQTGSRYAVQAVAKTGGQTSAVSDAVCFTVAFSADSDFTLVNGASDVSLITPREGSMESCLSVEYADSPTGSAYALQYKLKSAGNGYTDQAAGFYADIKYDNTEVPSYGLTAMVFWMDATDADKGKLPDPEKNITGDSTPFAQFVLKNSGNSGSSITIFDGNSSETVDFYLLPADGSEKIKLSSSKTQGIFIPHGFKGYVLVPLNENIDYSSYDQFYLKRYGKTITYTADDPTRTLYLSTVGFVQSVAYDQIGLDDIVIPDASGDVNLSTVTVSQDTIFDCTEFDAETNTLSSDTGVAYSFYNNSSRRGISVTLKDDGVTPYGAALEFRAPQSGIYDLSHYLDVSDGEDASGRLYYRVRRLASDKESTVMYPNGQDWYTLDVGGEASETQLSAAEIELKAGESVFIELYFDSDNSSGGTLVCSIGNPVMTLTDKTYDYKGYSASYVPADYHYFNRTAGTGGYIAQADRFSFNVMRYNGGEVEVEEISTYNSSFNNMLLNPSFSNAGYHYSSGNIQIEAKNNCGISLDFNVPESGIVTLTSNGISNQNLYTRVLKNDEVIYPSDGGWETFTSATTFTVSESASAGDKITLQMYSGAASTQYATLTALRISVTGGNSYNLPTDNEFSALLEQPYRGRDYEGRFEAAEDSVWSFGILNGTSGGLVTNAANAYDSDGRFLYHDSSESVGYHFSDDQLTFEAQGYAGSGMTDGRGFSVSMNVKESSLYDISSAFNIISGSGVGKFRILKNGEKIWPVISDWYSLNSENGTEGDVPAIECAAVAGDVITFEGMVSTPGKNDTVVLGLGSPTIRKVDPKVPQAQGYMSVYSPSDYAPVTFEDYSGAYIQNESRWNFGLLDKTGFGVVYADYYNSITGFSGNSSQTAGVIISDAGLTAKLSDEYGVSLDFTAPADGYADINLPISAADGVYYRVMLDDTQVYPESGWKEADGTAPEIDGVRVLEGQKISVQLYADGEASADLGITSVSYTSEHSNSAQAGESSFGALDADPYGDDDYTGEYVPVEGLWNFDIFRASDQELLKPDRYSSDEGGRLYNEASGAGWYFGDSSLASEVKINGENAYGVSLGFTVPETDLYDFQTAFTLGGDSSLKAKLYIRATHNGDVIWPLEGEWYECEASGSESVNVAAYEVDAVAGDEVRLEFYASEITLDGSPYDSLKIDMGAPSYTKSRATVVETPDASARVYAYQDYNPFGDLSYQGSYTPAEGRWNYEFLDATDPDNLKVIKADTYNSSNKKISSTSAPGAGLYVGVSGSVGNSEITCQNGSSYGTNLRFVSPITGNVLISGSPYINSAASVPDDAVVYFRILVNDEVVFPADGGWDEMTGESRSSTFGGIELEIEAGDNVIYQCYMKTSENKTISVLVNKPSIVLVSSVSSPKNSYNAKNDFTTNYQISPFWSYEYSLSRENLEYKQLESYGNDGYWSAAGLKQHTIDGQTRTEKLGVSNSRLWINNSIDGSDPGVAVYRFDVPEDGTYTINAASAITTNYSSGQMLARITLNGEKIWPADSDWQRLDKNNRIEFEQFTRELTAGDVLRFEGSIADGDIPSYNDSMVIWTPVVSLGGIQEEVTIYYGLNEADVEFFQKIATAAQFDQNYEQSKKDYEDSLNETDNGGGTNGGGSTNSGGNTVYIPGTPGTPGTEGTPGYWIPGSEDTIRRIVTTTVSGIPVWVIILIVAGGVLLAGGVTVTLIILKKKGKIGGRKRLKSSNQ